MLPCGFIELSTNTIRFAIHSIALDRSSYWQVQSVLKDIGKVRDVAQLPSGDLLILLDQNSPNRGDSGRIVKLSRKDGS